MNTIEVVNFEEYTYYIFDESHRLCALFIISSTQQKKINKNLRTFNEKRKKKFNKKNSLNNIIIANVYEQKKK